MKADIYRKTNEKIDVEISIFDTNQPCTGTIYSSMFCSFVITEPGILGLCFALPCPLPSSACFALLLLCFGLTLPCSALVLLRAAFALLCFAVLYLLCFAGICSALRLVCSDFLCPAPCFSLLLFCSSLVLPGSSGKRRRPCTRGHCWRDCSRTWGKQNRAFCIFSMN